MNKQEEMKKAFADTPFNGAIYARKSIAAQKARGEYPRHDVGTWNDPRFIQWQGGSESRS